LFLLYNKYFIILFFYHLIIYLAYFFQSLERHNCRLISKIILIKQIVSDALKLIIKETVIPSSSNKVLFYLAPVIAIIVSLLGWSVIPLGQGLVISDFSMGVLFTLTLSSLGVYGILFAG
jgi:NADH:ubiquinone oxidoreductase subunit H